MLFKRFVKFKKSMLTASVLFLLSCTTLLGCAKENDQPYSVDNLGLQSTNCLSDLPDIMKNYFAGVAKENEVTAMWTCINSSLKTFSRRYRPNDSNSYTAEELREFIEEFFVDKEKLDPVTGHFISDELLDELMGVKRLVIGGSRRRLTYEEIQRSYGFFTEMNGITQILRPYVRILLVNDKDLNPTLAEYNVAIDSLKLAMTRFFGLIDREGAIYEMASLQRLFKELDLFIAKNSSNESSEPSQIDKYIPVFAALKSLLTNSSSNVIESSEWVFLGELLGNGIDSLLRTTYFFKSNSLKDVNALIELDSTFKSFFAILKISAARYKNNSLPLEGFDHVSKSLANIDFLPFGFSYEQMGPIIRLFFDKILNPQKRYLESGLSVEKINYLQTEMNHWVKIQKLLITENVEENDSRWEEMKEILRLPFSLSLDELERVILNGVEEPTNLSSTTRLNWLTGIFRILFSVYSDADSSKIEDMKLTEEQLSTAVEDLRDILVGLELINKNDTTFAAGMFRDASLFMPRSDGDKTVGFIEMVEYIHMVIAGIATGNLFLNNLNPGCLVLDEKSVHTACFRSALPAQSNHLFSHKPHFLKYTSELDDKMWQKLIKNLETINRSEGYVNEPILEADIKESFVLLQYVEVIMMRFDRDRSGYLNLKEILAMLDLFKGIIGDLLGLDVIEDAEEIEILFTYLIKYGSVPDPINDPLAEVRYKNWAFQKGKWRLKASRNDLLSLLAKISKL